MTDKLTTRLHAVGDNVAANPPPAARGRANAERRRRTRRLTGGVGIAVVAVLLGTGVLVGNLRSPRPVPPISPPPSTSHIDPPTLPVRTPPVQPSFYELMFARDENVVIVLESSVVSDRPHVRLENALEAAIPSERGRCPGSTGGCVTNDAAPKVYELAPDPTLTRTDLDYFEELSAYYPDWKDMPADAAVPTLTTCLPDPAGMGAAKAHVAGFVTLTGSKQGPNGSLEPRTPNDPGYLIETVLQFDDQLTAANAYRLIRDQALSCDYSVSYLTVDGLNTVPNWPVDELFVAELQPPA